MQYFLNYKHYNRFSAPRLNSTKRPRKCTDAEMDGHTDDYCDFVFEQMAAINNPQVFVEQKVDCTEYVPECKGTVDCLLIGNGVVHVIDLTSDWM